MVHPYAWRDSRKGVLRTRPPARQKLRKVFRPYIAAGIEVSRARARSPCCEQRGEIGRADNTVAAEVSRTGRSTICPCAIRSHVEKITAQSAAVVPTVELEIDASPIRQAARAVIAEASGASRANALEDPMGAFGLRYLDAEGIAITGEAAGACELSVAGIGAAIGVVAQECASEKPAYVL